MDPLSWIDKPASVRPGEELDREALAANLRDQFPDLDVSAIEVTQFRSGHSNLTYLLRLGEREMVLRRPPFGAKIKTAHDMLRESHILSHLIQVYPKVPRMLAYCGDETVMGVPFYLMERLRGVILRGSKSGNVEIPAEQMLAIAENFVDNLVEIHQVDYRAAGLGDLGRPQGYVKRQADGWTQRYFKARTDDIPEMLVVAKWLAEHIPPGADDTPDVGESMTAAALIHNDYKYDNLVLDPEDLGVGKIIGVLDWEMATIGDPLMDLGTALGYWIDPDDPPEMQAMNFGLTTLPGNLKRREIAERYAQKSGRDLSNICFYYIFALFKIAVIIQQIYARYRAGYTTDERFATFILAVGVLGIRAVQVINMGRIDNL